MVRITFADARRGAREPDETDEEAESDVLADESAPDADRRGVGAVPRPDDREHVHHVGLPVSSPMPSLPAISSLDQLGATRATTSTSRARSSPRTLGT